MNNIFVINLDKDTTRLANFDANMQKYGVKYTRIPGIYGKNVVNDKTKVTWSCRILCSYGIIGCYLSHSQLWTRLANDPDADHYVVLEDDALFTDDTIHVINQAILKFGQSFDIFTLFTFSDNMALACYNDSLLNGKYKVCKNPIILSTLGYIISKKGAINILDKLGHKASYHVDFMLNLSQTKGINYMSVSPNVLVNNGFLDSNLLEGAVIYSPIDWGLKAIILSLHQKINIRNGHLYSTLLLILTFTVLNWIPWMIKLVFIICSTVLFCLTPF